MSALNLISPHRAVALVDNVGTTPARVFDLRVNSRPTSVSVDGMTILRRPDGTPYNGGDFDGEGLVVERGNRTILATSEREPSIRRFRLSDGKQLASLPVPARFQVAPAGEATTNATHRRKRQHPEPHHPVWRASGARVPPGRAVRVQAGPGARAGRHGLGQPDRADHDGTHVHPRRTHPRRSSCRRRSCSTWPTAHHPAPPPSNHSPTPSWTTSKP
ncbi:esterase-like activity of phytase family protein [Kribbella sp. GL6]|uniref:esterase-like activity of phytase family protein n=1 Tax=Kribbella sp. GL6 TaxID=3419765 RepID=UPI003D068044